MTMHYTEGVVFPRYQVREDDDEGYGVWDLYLLRWVSDTHLSEYDAGVILRELTGES